MRTTRIFLNTSEIRSVKISSCTGSDPANVIGPTCLQSIDASDLSSATPRAPLMHAGLGARDVAGDTADLRIIVRVDDDLMVGSDELEHRVDLTNRVGPHERTKRQQQEDNEFLHGMSSVPGAVASQSTGIALRRSSVREA